jgi:hypothetical protein
VKYSQRSALMCRQYFADMGQQSCIHSAPVELFPLEHHTRDCANLVPPDHTIALRSGARYQGGYRGSQNLLISQRIVGKDCHIMGAHDRVVNHPDIGYFIERQCDVTDR